MEHTVFGLLGYASAAIGFFVSNDKNTKALLVAACVLNAAYYLLNDMYISASIVVLTGVRMALSIWFRHHAFPVIFISLAVMTPWLISSDDWLSVIPGITGTVAAYWMSGPRMRLMMMFGSVVWIVNNSLAGAWVGVIGETVLIIAGLCGLISSGAISRSHPYLRIHPKKT